MYIMHNYRGIKTPIFCFIPNRNHKKRHVLVDNLQLSPLVKPILDPIYDPSLTLTLVFFVLNRVTVCSMCIFNKFNPGA